MTQRFTLSTNASTFLDWLRVFAAQTVVIGHGAVYFGVLENLRPPNGPYLQEAAVVIFFILSGFLIAYTVDRKQQKEGGYPFAEFFSDRFTRIYSAWIPGLLFVAFVDWLHRDVWGLNYKFSAFFTQREFWGNLFQLQDFAPFQPPFYLKNYSAWFNEFFSGYFYNVFGTGRPFWTVQIEWWLYLFYGWLLLGYRGKHKLWYLLVLLLLLPTPVYHSLAPERGGALARIWFYGVLVFFALTWPRLSRLPAHMALGLGLLCGWMAYLRINQMMDSFELWGMELMVFSFAFLLWAFQQSREKIPGWIVNSGRFFASYSFTLYIVHYSIIDLLYEAKLDWTGTQLIWFAFVVSNLASILLAYVGERNHKWLRKRLSRLFFSRSKLP